MLEVAVFVIAILVIALFVTLPAPSVAARNKKARLLRKPQKHVKRSEIKRYRQELAELKHDFDCGYISLSQFDRERAILKASLDGKFSGSDRNRGSNQGASRRKPALSAGVEQASWIDKLMACRVNL